MIVAGGESSPGTWAGILKCAMSIATPATPDNATQILVARLDTDKSFLPRVLVGS